jgi:lipopolysaccharide transport system permease protein
MSAATEVRQPTVIRPMRGLFDFGLDEVWRSRELLYFLVWRDLKVRYSQAALGAMWAVLQPLVAVMIFTVIFGIFARLPSDGVPYPVFAFTAMLPWTLFSESARRSSLGLVGDGELIKKVYFPRLIIPLANVVSPLIDFMFSIGALVLLMLFYGIVPSINIVFAPLLVVLTMALAFAIGLWLGPLNVRFRDITHTIPFLMQIWMYATPIVYPLSMVPDRYKFWYSLNPTVGLIEGYRWAVLGAGTLDISSLVTSALITVVLLVTGLIWFKQQERNFADII